jgi:hypothetical protein
MMSVKCVCVCVCVSCVVNISCQLVRRGETLYTHTTSYINPCMSYSFEVIMEVLTLCLFLLK